MQTIHIDLEFLANTLAQAESRQCSLEQAVGGIGLYANTNKTEFSCFKQESDISTWSGRLKVNKFSYLGSYISFTESDINTCLAKEWVAIDRLSIIWKFDLSDKIKQYFFQAVSVSIL